jgi:hypothetical protein
MDHFRPFSSGMSAVGPNTMIGGLHFAQMLHLSSARSEDGSHPLMEGIEVYRLLTALMFASALAFGFGYVSSPTYAQGTDQTEAGSDQAPTDESARPDESGSDEMGTDDSTEMPPDEDMPSDDQSDDGSNE